MTKEVKCGNCVYRRPEGVCVALPPQIVPVSIASPHRAVLVGAGNEVSLAEIQLATAFPSVQVEGAICSLYTEKEEMSDEEGAAEE